MTLTIADVDVAAPWRERAGALAHWFMQNAANRVDVWGGYKPLKFRDGTGASVTKPRTDRRGIDTLTVNVLRRHFEGRNEGDVAGLHTTSAENTCRFVVIDIDQHANDEDTARVNWVAALAFRDKLMELGFTVWLEDSNGNGGFHLWAFFADPVSAPVAFAFAQWLIADWRTLGLTDSPETYPKQARIKPGGCGNFARLPGRHHTRAHWSRFWDGSTWLVGTEAIDLILTTGANRIELIPDEALPPEPQPAAPKPNKGDGTGDRMTDQEVAERCLAHIGNSDLHYDDWLRVGAACNSASSGPRMFDAFRSWSQQSVKHDEAKTEATWRSFRRAGTGCATVGTLVHLARQNGFDVYRDRKHEMKRRRKVAGADGSNSNTVLQLDANDEANPDRLTQQTNAEHLIRELNGTARYNVSRGEWMVTSTDEGRLVIDTGGVVARAAKRIARRMWDIVASPPSGMDRKIAIRHAVDSEKAAGIAAMMTLARTEAGIPIVNTDLDRDPFTLNLLNGTLHVPSGELRPHRPEDLISKLAPVRFDEGATCPLFDRFMARIMAGDEGMIRYLQRIAGLCLTGINTVQELFILWGGGANGKSVFIDTLLALLGDYAGTAPDSLLTVRANQEHPTEIADLCGRRLVAASETEEGARLRVQLVKRLTGDLMLKGRYMRCDFFEFPRTHKLLLVTNNRPRINETTNAVWRRVRLVPFAVTIPPAERDVNLLQKLRAEWPGILNWCVAGYQDFEQHGMQTPETVKVATQSYQSEQDPLGEFIAERCILAANARVCRKRLFTEYQTWAKGAGDESPDRNSFYDRMRRIPGIDEATERVDGRPTRVFRGIASANIGSQYQQAHERLSEEV